jgi:glycosyltransferase involved in cell wall biosynthesis
MKKVCIIRRKSYEQQRNLQRDVAALVEAGYQVDVICFGLKGQQKFEVVGGVNIYRIILPYVRGNTFLVIYGYFIFFLLSFFKLSWLTAKKHYDVVEVDTMPDFLVFITFFSRLLGSKVILYMFEDMPTLFMSSYKVGPKHLGTRLLRFFEEWSAKYADRVIVSDGQHYKRTLESRGIPADKITVILNVPDYTIFDSESINAKKNHHFRLVIVSTLVKRYGVQTIVKALPQIIKNIPELTVDIAGDGEFLPELQKMASELNVDKYILFKGLVPYVDIPSIIARADIGLAPMSDDVGLPNKLFEYFALGKPAIASAQPSLVSAFGRDGAVLFFEPDNEEELAKRILELYQDPGKRASLVSLGYEFYKNYHWSKLKQDYLKVFEELARK